MKDPSQWRTKAVALANEVLATKAAAVDQDAVFPAEALDALRESGLLGLISAVEVGGLGQGLSEAAELVQQLAQRCASTASIVALHLVGAAVLERLGTRASREAVAAGELVTCALSEPETGRQFWRSAHKVEHDGVYQRLTGFKTSVMAATEARYVIWSAPSMDAVDLWLIPSASEGLQIGELARGPGLRGTGTAPLMAKGVRVTHEQRLGIEGAGGTAIRGILVPYYNVLTTACLLGLMEQATLSVVAHVTDGTRTHLAAVLAERPKTRAMVARMRVRTDMSRAMLSDTAAGLAKGRLGSRLRALECHAAACECATEVLGVAMKLCGGIAGDMGVERYFRDTKAMTLLTPTTETLYELVGYEVCGLVPMM